MIQLAQDEYQEIYLAVNDENHQTFFQRKSIQGAVKLNHVSLLVVNITNE